MRILHVVESLERGGLERIVVSLARAQRANGHEVEVNCLFREGLLAAELRSADVPVRCAGKRAGVDLAALSRLRGHARGFDAELVHSHNAVANYYAAAAVLGSDAGLVNTRHGMGVGVSTRGEQLYSLSLRRTAAVAAVCEAARRRFVASRLVPESKLRVVRNGIQLPPAGAPDTARAAARATLGLPADAYVVGTVGRLNPAKNHARLIDAFAMLQADRPHSRLVIVGDGPLRQDVADQVHARGIDAVTRLTGDRGDVAALLPAFDVFALTSDTEGYSVALLEAGAAALPCVVSDVGGNSEIVQDDGTGIVVRAATADAFSAALGLLAGDAARRQEMGRAARSWVERHGSSESMTRDYDSFYHSALRRDRGEASAA